MGGLVRIVLTAAVLLLLALAPALAQHPGGMPPLPPPAAPATGPEELLKAARFLTVAGLTGELPQGTFELRDGIVAILPGSYLHGLALGQLAVNFSSLPGYTSADGALNLFREIDGPDAPVRFDALAAAYVSAALDSGFAITDYGVTSKERAWDELTDAECAQFEQLLAQCLSDGWTEPGSASPREPVGSEIYAALWNADENGGLGQRWDFRADTDGNLSIEEYARGITWYAYPWAREEGKMTDGVWFKSIQYTYTLHPPEAAAAEQTPARVEVEAKAEIRLNKGFTPQPAPGAPAAAAAKPAPQITLLSDPHITWTEASLHHGSAVQATYQPGTPLSFSRANAPASPWQLSLGGEFWAGNYTVVLRGYCDIPEDYASFGYGGAYRFDETALWPGEDAPVDVGLGVFAPGGYTPIMSAGLEMDDLRSQDGVGNDLRSIAVGTASQSTRNQMLVLTQLPSRTIPTHWGELEVYAPADLIDSVEQTEAVQAIGPIIDYYSAIWGDRGVDKLPVFILPDETGVQGFMNAGMVFILGGEGGHGGAGSSMGGLTALLAHELAHLWWGQDVAAPRWFVEGLANYGAAKYLEQQALASGGGDPYFYRRYLMNFALGYELPLSLPRRDELDDNAAIYHNAPAGLLTFDARLPRGLDPLLAQLWQERRGQPELSNDALREFFAGQPGGQLAELWDSYIKRGSIPQADEEDATYRELTRTPERENYRRLLEWLMPARRKAAAGDYAGAMYCANRALEFRAEPKDYAWLAELALLDGRPAEALERCIVILEEQEPDAVVVVKVHDVLARCYLAQGDTQSAAAAYQYVAEYGMEAGLISLVQDARAQLAALGAEVPDAQTGATSNPHGQ
jgi:hypothetical protein